MTMRACLLLMPILVGSPLYAADPVEGLDEYVTAAMVQWQVPGASIAIVKDGEVVLMRGYGVTRNDDGHAVTPETIFPLASITKNFTATALGVLVEEGKVGWDDPVVKHLPGIRFSDDYRTQHTTICDLLCHRTGLERGDMLPRRNDVTNEEILRRIRYLQPVHGFREKWEYNNLMYYLAGEVVAKASGRDWEQFLAERLLQPLDMNSTTTRHPESPSNRTAVPHRLIDGKPIPDEPLVSVSKFSPAGSMHSTAADMAKWLLASLASLDHERALLKPETRRLMQSIHMSVPAAWDRTGNPYAARFYGWGFGWRVLDYRGRKLCYHGGSSGAMFAVMPEERLGVVILTNLHWTTLSGMLMYDLLDAWLVGPERDLIYRDLAKDLVAAGLAVVRYDNRGVRCNEMTMPPSPESGQDQDAEFAASIPSVLPEPRGSSGIQAAGTPCVRANQQPDRWTKRRKPNS